VDLAMLKGLRPKKDRKLKIRFVPLYDLQIPLLISLRPTIIWTSRTWIRAWSEWDAVVEL
jgi:hypothetical protein